MNNSFIYPVKKKQVGEERETSESAQCTSYDYKINENAAKYLSQYLCKRMHFAHPSAILPSLRKRERKNEIEREQMFIYLILIEVIRQATNEYLVWRILHHSGDDACK